MSENKKILILSLMEYGDLTDQVKWTEYLGESFEVVHLSESDKASEDRSNKNITIKKIVTNKESFIKRRITFTKQCRRFMDEFKPDIVIMDYFPGCSLMKVFRKEKMIMDIRTSTISSSRKKVIIRDGLIKLESVFFDKVTIISNNIIDKLKLNRNKCVEIPLGATKVVDDNSLSTKSSESINMLYVGVFDEREIEKSVYAVRDLLKKRPEINIKYTLIGFSKYEEYEKKIKDIIVENNLEKYIDYVGKVEHSKLKNYYEENNVGLSFVPLKECFDLQPPTKTYEYILNGLYCIATKTSAQKDIITKENGILIGDDIADIVDGLEEVYDKLKEIDYLKVEESLRKCNWKNIVNEKLKPTIEDIIL